MRLLVMSLLLVLVGCTTSPPANVDNVCEIFREKRRWYDDAAKARKKWGSPISVMMAIIHQESRFKAKAKPPRKKILGVIPGPRPSNSYGYTQALKGTWKGYKRSAGRYGADRDDFGDSIDFVGWYNDQSYQQNGIAKTDGYRLYLAYHEGQGGYARGSFSNKAWLKSVANKVNRRAGSYRTQLLACEKEFTRRGWFFGRL